MDGIPGAELGEDDLEREYRRRHPERAVHPERLRVGARAREGQPPR